MIKDLTFKKETLKEPTENSGEGVPKWCKDNIT